MRSDERKETKEETSKGKEREEGRIGEGGGGGGGGRKRENEVKKMGREDKQEKKGN